MVQKLHNSAKLGPLLLSFFCIGLFFVHSVRTFFLHCFLSIKHCCTFCITTRLLYETPWVVRYRCIKQRKTIFWNDKNPEKPALLEQDWEVGVRHCQLTLKLTYNVIYYF